MAWIYLFLFPEYFIIYAPAVTNKIPKTDIIVGIWFKMKIAGIIVANGIKDISGATILISDSLNPIVNNIVEPAKDIEFKTKEIQNTYSVGIIILFDNINNINPVTNRRPPA